MITMGVDLETNRKNLFYSQKYQNVYSAVGIHPHESKKINGKDLDEVDEMLSSSKIMAVGEIGLDYYYNHSPKEIQKKIFCNQIDLARKHNLPIIVHDRDAHEDMVEILSERARGMRVLLHCFSGDKKMAQWGVNQGFYFGIGGVITFKNAQELVSVIQGIPLERIVLETDSPFLTPVPFRGRSNEPMFIPMIAQKLAEIKEVPVSKIGKSTTENAYEIFKFKDQET